MTARIQGISLALILSGAPICAAETKNIDKTLALSAVGAITLDAHNGSIQVRTWDRSEIEIHVRIEASGTSADARRRFSETTVEIDSAPDRISIRSKLPGFDSWSWWSWLGNWGDWDGSPAVHYTITAPRSARWTIRNHNAKAEIRDVNAALELDTHNGDIWVTNLGGSLELNMHNGDAHIDFASFTHESRVTTHNGTVDLALPASSKFDFHSRGHNMRVDSDFPATGRSSDFGRHDVNGRVNGGGPELLLTSHNGGFRLRSK
jgi:hypothetical protein